MYAVANVTYELNVCLRNSRHLREICMKHSSLDVRKFLSSFVFFFVFHQLSLRICGGVADVIAGTAQHSRNCVQP